MKRIFPDTATSPARYLEFLVPGLLLTLAFGLAAWLGPRLEVQFPERADLDDPLAVLLGDTRQLFANSFFVKADAYFHSGYYPTIYDDNAPFKTPHIGEDSGTMESKNSGDENGFLGQPHDWIERLNRNFFPSEHTHLDGGGVDGEGATEVKEIMPWLKISAELDVHRVETYLVTAYWLRNRMHKVNEAEQFLRDGLRANPDNAALLFELGQLYFESRNQPGQARNLYLPRSTVGAGKIPAARSRTNSSSATFLPHLPNWRNTKAITPKPSNISNRSRPFLPALTQSKNRLTNSARSRLQNHEYEPPHRN